MIRDAALLTTNGYDLGAFEELNRVIDGRTDTGDEGLERAVVRVGIAARTIAALMPRE